MVLPLLAVYRSRGDFRVHFYNIKQAWTWVFDDFKWLSLMMAASINTKIKLPDQGKFNAAEKVNFMVLMGTYPLYIATGLFIWLTHVAFVSWLMHTAMALMATPLILGHMYMAIVSRSGRPGLTGMKNGYVDRHWAKHPLRALVPGALRTRRGRCAGGEGLSSGAQPVAESSGPLPGGAALRLAADSNSALAATGHLDTSHHWAQQGC